MKPDLNLLAVFEAVARQGSVTAAATEMNLSQSAVSHALNRLRALVGDPLFTRAGRGLVPTPHAVGMLDQARNVLAGAQALMAPALFDPASASAHFRIAASDYAALTVVPTLVAALRRAAPAVTLAILPVGPGVCDELESGRLDLSFWGAAPPTAPFHHAPLFEERYIGLADEDHPMFMRVGRGGVTLDLFLAYPHLTVSLGAPGANAIDQALAALGHTRRVGAKSFSFAGNIATLRGSDFLAAAPARLVRAGALQGLREFALPLEVPPYGYGMIWHARTHAAPGHRWLRDCVAAATRV